MTNEQFHSLPCVVCKSTVGIEAAHVNYSDAKHGVKRAMGLRRDENRVPLCAWCHRLGAHSQHEHGDERGWWESVGLDPYEVAASLREKEFEEASEWILTI